MGRGTMRHGRRHVKPGRFDPGRGLSALLSSCNHHEMKGSTMNPALNPRYGCDCGPCRRLTATARIVIAHARPIGPGCEKAPIEAYNRAVATPCEKEKESRC